MKLTKYEIIERQRNDNSLDSIKLIKQNGLRTQFVYCPHEETKIVDSNMQSILSKYSLEAEERRQAIEQLARTTIEILLPYTHKYLLWAAQTGTGPFNSEFVDSNLEYTVNGEWDSVLETVQASEEELRGTLESKSFFTHSAAALRKIASQFIVCQRQLQEQIRLIDEHFHAVLMPKLSLPTLHAFVKWVDNVLYTPNIVDAKQT